MHQRSRLSTASAGTSVIRPRGGGSAAIPPAFPPRGARPGLTDAGDWDPAFWWTAIVWGTAAVGTQLAANSIRQINSILNGLDLPLDDDFNRTTPPY